MRRRVLVSRLDSLGDVVLAGPAIRAVAAGAERVTLLAGPRGRAAAELLPGVDRVMEFDAPWINPEPRPVDPAEVGDLVRRVRTLEVDEAIILGSFHQSPLPLALLLRLAGVHTIAAGSEDYPGSLLDVRHLPDPDLHEAERGLSTVAALGYRLPPEDWGELRVRAEAPSAAAAALGSYVAVHPGASAPARAWPEERHAELVEELVLRGRRVVVTGAPHEAALTARVSGSSDSVLDLGGRTSLRQLAGVFSRAQAVVVANTGPAHVAAAVGTPVVSLFAPTVPHVRWRPWMVPHRLLGWQEAPCAGSRALTCPVNGHPCLSGVTAAEAADALDRLVETRLEAAAS